MSRFLYSETPTAHMHTMKVVVVDLSGRTETTIASSGVRIGARWRPRPFRPSCLQGGFSRQLTDPGDIVGP